MRLNKRRRREIFNRNTAERAVAAMGGNPDWSGFRRWKPWEMRHWNRLLSKMMRGIEDQIWKSVDDAAINGASGEEDK